MTTPHRLPLDEAAPLARLYHENSKITEGTSAQFAERIAEFTLNVDALRRAATSSKTYPGIDRVDLNPYRSVPFPRVPLHDLLMRRRSVREFRDGPLPLARLAALLESATGVTGEMTSPQHPEIVQHVRAHPSGGALYPIEIYVAALAVEGLAPGLYHFHAPQHCLESVCPGDFRDELARNLWCGEGPLQAPVVLLLTGRWELPLWKYGERGYRILLLVAGHVMENLLLTSGALNLGACPIAGFHDDRLAQLLALDPREEPVLYAMLAGIPADGPAER